jgi:hypothetical protein
MRRLGLFLVAVVVVVLASVVHPPAARAERQGGVIRLEEITIEGRVQKPNAFYVLQRSSLGFEQAQVDQSFVDDVVESVNREPF